MNAMFLKPGWRAALAPARLRRLKQRQGGFARFERARLPGIEPRLANALGRFEQEARFAAREWLML
jgi:hypothetical protein